MIRNEPHPWNTRLGELPDFELEYLVDDQVEPTEVTIFSPEEDEVTTRWVSIPIDDAVPLEAVR